jgi:alkanesulfonate monooxygenase SsuD/methylene tetrahydromethanopterin reductase-like flavin-dependent oxidoreductase (luciferase family)
VSGGRVVLGLGAGCIEGVFQAFGMPFLPIKDRLDQLEETAIVLRRLFDGERVTFAGKQIHLTDALCDPRPVQPRLRLWVGGQGEKRLLRIVAKHADGWNVPFLAPEVFAQRAATLDDWCDREGRDRRAVTRTINVGLALGRDEAAAQRQEEKLPSMFGGLTEFVRPGILTGTPPRVIDRIGEYERAGAEWVILALRAPFDWEGLEVFIQDVMPAFR